MKHSLYNVIKAAYISEKATQVTEAFGHFVFEVAIDATKPEIKSAVEALFNVKVKSVNTLVQKGKRKSFGRRPGKRSDRKKAYVSLMPGYDINFVVAD